MPLYTSNERPKISTNNAYSGVALAGDATIPTQTWECTLHYSAVTVIISADVDSADGGIEVQFNVSGSGDPDTIMLDSYKADTKYIRVFRVQGPYFRLAYTNGSSAQSASPSMTCILNQRQEGIEPACTQVEFCDTAYDAFRRLRTSQPHTLISIAHHYGKNEHNVAEYLAGALEANRDSSHQALKSCVDMQLTAATDGTAHIIRQSRRYAEYQPGKSLLWMGTGVLNADSNGADCLTQLGLFDDNNGVFFSFQNGVLSVNVRNNASPDPVTTSVASTAFNVDRLDGKGPSRIKIDVTKAQIWWCDIEWLGVGRVRFGIVTGGKLHICHVFKHANEVTHPYMQTANLPIRYEIKATGTSTATGKMRMICSTVVSEAGYDTVGHMWSHGRLNDDTVTVDNNEKCILAIRLKSTHHRARVVVRGFSLLATENADYVYRLYRWHAPSTDPLSGGDGWTFVHANSAIEYHDGTVSIWTDAHVMHHGFMSNRVREAFDGKDAEIVLTAGIGDPETGTSYSDVLALMCQRAVGDTQKSVTGSFIWTEHEH